MNNLDQLKIGNKTFNSRLMLGTGKYKTIDDTINSLKKSECEIVTAAVRRLPLNIKNDHSCFLNSLNWKNLMKGNVSSIREQIGGEFSTSVISLATIVTKTKEDNETGEETTVEYQSIYNRAFLPAYSLKNFRLVDYSKSSVIEQLSKKQLKNMKPHEKFVMNLIGEYGCKDYYVFQDIQDYDPDANLVASDKAIEEDGADYYRRRAAGGHRCRGRADPAQTQGHQALCSRRCRARQAQRPPEDHQDGRGCRASCG